jgi:hypothetical protein
MNTLRALELKLAKLPDRSPVKMTIALAPPLHGELLAYADLYHEVHGVAEPLATLVPHMLESFLASDRAFVFAKKKRSAAPPNK